MKLHFQLKIVEPKIWLYIFGYKLNPEISENEARKDFSKAERIDYARCLERIESLKAEKNKLANLKQNTNSQNSDYLPLP